MNAEREESPTPPVSPSSIILYALDFARRREIITPEEAHKAKAAHLALIQTAELLIEWNEGPTNRHPIPETKAAIRQMEGGSNG